MTLPNNLKSIREAHGLSMESLAYLSGLSRMTIANLENGNLPSGQTVASLTHALRVKPTDIFPWLDGSQNEPAGVDGL